MLQPLLHESEVQTVQSILKQAERNEAARVTVIKTRVEIGDDRVLHLQLPPDTPTGRMELLLVLEEAPNGGLSLEARRTAAQAGLGALKEFGGSVDEFLAERLTDDERREQALGL
jgi:hypothetical protein